MPSSSKLDRIYYKLYLRKTFEHWPVTLQTLGPAKKCEKKWPIAMSEAMCHGKLESKILFILDGNISSRAVRKEAKSPDNRKNKMARIHHWTMYKRMLARAWKRWTFWRKVGVLNSPPHIPHRHYILEIENKSNLAKFHGEKTGKL